MRLGAPPFHEGAAPPLIRVHGEIEGKRNPSRGRRLQALVSIPDRHAGPCQRQWANGNDDRPDRQNSFAGRLSRLHELIQQVRKPIPAADFLIQKSDTSRAMPAQMLIQLETEITSRVNRLSRIVDTALCRFML